MKEATILTTNQSIMLKEWICLLMLIKIEQILKHQIITITGLTLKMIIINI